MTRRQRAQVVELLRCAADIAASKRWMPWPFGIAQTAVIWLDPSTSVCSMATRVATETAGGIEAGQNADEYIANILEAAARVEEGSWP